MKQMSLGAGAFERYSKTTRRAAFRAERECVMPWSTLCALIEPVYPKAGNGRPPTSERPALDPDNNQQEAGTAKSISEWCAVGRRSEQAPAPTSGGIAKRPAAIARN